MSLNTLRRRWPWIDGIKEVVGRWMQRGLITPGQDKPAPPPPPGVLVWEFPPSRQDKRARLAWQRMCMARLRAERAGKDTSSFPARMRAKITRKNRNEDTQGG